MATLGPNRYGKAEVRLMKVDRGADRHRLHDLTVDVALAGDMEGAHVSGDNSAVLPTDTQKNTVFAFAREHGVSEIEEFAVRLARHFVDDQPSIHRARVAVREHTWGRVEDRPHTFAQSGGEARTTVVTFDGETERFLSGLTGLVVLSTTGSEFRGFVRDRYTTLAEAGDRILCTTVDATWRHATPPTDWGKDFDAGRAALLSAFADTYSHSLQETLYAMGERLLDSCSGAAEVRLSLPNRHHFLVDLAPFGLDNPGEVFYVADRPYGLIEGTVLADDATPDPEAWW
ncbi:MAG TPA: urate oxidase [Nocardioidaceae bacterium]|nr:urate oxidase [Nocardioidaceae bacterium]